MGKEQWYQKVQLWVTYLSDHVLGAGIILWLTNPTVRDVLGAVGLVGGIVLVLGRNYGMFLDNRYSKMRLKLLEDEARRRKSDQD